MLNIIYNFVKTFKTFSAWLGIKWCHSCFNWT